MKTSKPIVWFGLFSMALLLSLLSCSNSSSPQVIYTGGPSVTGSVEIAWEATFGAFEAVASGSLADAEEKAFGEPANYSVSYQWQSSDTGSDGSWENIAADPSNPYFYQPSADKIGKYLRVKIDWKYGGASQAAVFSKAVQIQNRLNGLLLEYSGFVLAGTAVDASKIVGVLSDIRGDSVSGYSVTAKDADAAKPTFSDYILFEVSKESYPTEEVSILVPVQGVLKAEDVPALSTDATKISSGKARFSASRDDLEFSTDGGSSWKALSADEFDASAGNTIKVRKKAVGQANYYGYLKESEPVAVTVAAENIGKNSSSSIEIDFKHLELGLTKVEVEEDSVPLVKINAELSNADVIKALAGAAESYAWFVDGSEIIASDSANPMYCMDNGQTLVMNKNKLPHDVYQVECRFCFKRSPDDEGFGFVSRQISVTVQ